MIDTRIPDKYRPSQARMLANAAKLFEPGAVSLLGKDPIDEGARIIMLSVLGPVGAHQAAADDTLEIIITKLWFDHRQLGLPRGSCVELINRFAESFGVGFRHTWAKP